MEKMTEVNRKPIKIVICHDDGESETLFINVPEVRGGWVLRTGSPALFDQTELTEREIAYVEHDILSTVEAAIRAGAQRDSVALRARLSFVRRVIAIAVVRGFCEAKRILIACFSRKEIEHDV